MHSERKILTRMINLNLTVVAAALLFTVSFSTATDLNGDANIYTSVIKSLEQLKIQRAQEKSNPNVIQRASSVCYDELGCFDKEGTFKHLKQLPEPPETVNTQFLLYTRKNRLTPQILDYKKPETVLESNINPKVPLKIITHGFGGRNNLTWVWEMKNALLQMHDVNIMIVDWSLGARVPYYIQAAVNSELVGAQTAVMYYFIKDNLGIQEKDLHLIGFSLGAQVVGFVGKRMKELRGTRPSRITGLDAASPLFEDYGGEVHLWKEDADFVDVVHTNADLLIYGGVGIGLPLGHVDFYPNGGKRQPGCGSTIGGALKDLFGNDRERTCNHERAVHLYTDSILNPDGCRFTGYKCSNYTHFQRAECMNCGDDCGHMGYHVEGAGIYYLMTRSQSPFCTDMAQMTVHFGKDVKKSYGSIIITLVGPTGAKQNVTITEKDEKLLPGGTKMVAITLDSELVPLTAVEVLYLRYNGWITKGAPTFVLNSVVIKNPDGTNIFKTCEEDILLNDNEYQKLKNC